MNTLNVYIYDQQSPYIFILAYYFQKNCKIAIFTFCKLKLSIFIDFPTYLKSYLIKNTIFISLCTSFRILDT